MVWPDGTRLFIYEKCGQEAEGQDAMREVFSHVEVTDLPDPPDLRRDECAAYLAHIINRYDGEDTETGFANFTVFLQSDASDHLKPSFLEVALRSIGAGGYDVPFLHLNTPRLVTMTSRCKMAAYLQVFEERPEESL